MPVGYRLLSLFRLWRVWEHVQLVIAGMQEELAEANAAIEVERKVRLLRVRIVLQRGLHRNPRAHTRCDGCVRR